MVLPIPPSLLGAHHEPDLAGGFSGCGGVRVLRDGEYPSSYFLELADEREVDPETLALGGDVALLAIIDEQVMRLSERARDQDVG